MHTVVFVAARRPRRAPRCSKYPIKIRSAASQGEEGRGDLGLVRFPLQPPEAGIEDALNEYLLHRTTETQVCGTESFWNRSLPGCVSDRRAFTRTLSIFLRTRSPRFRRPWTTESRRTERLLPRAGVAKHEAEGPSETLQRRSCRHPRPELTDLRGDGVPGGGPRRSPREHRRAQTRESLVGLGERGWEVMGEAMVLEGVGGRRWRG